MAAVTLSSRRFACNRCRDQKLRCPRQRLDPDRCDRCLRADVECLTTPGPTTGNQLADISLPGARKRKYPAPHLTPTDTHTGMSSLRVHPNSIDSTDWSQLWDGLPHDLDFRDGFNDMIMSPPSYQFTSTCTVTTAVGECIVAPLLMSWQDAAGSSLDEDCNAQNSQSPSPDTYSLESYLHRLSSINLSLVSQLSRIDQVSPR
ncbi:hypothetical protein F4678DRAFT_97885 [Xylaria arbuscula]|nr:hypothetical protein F4678DRAFT_97885 [Xylaria arbuscula]